MKSEGREFAGNCNSNPTNLHHRRTTSLLSAHSSTAMPKGLWAGLRVHCSARVEPSPEPWSKARGANCAPASLVFTPTPSLAHCQGGGRDVFVYHWEKTTQPVVLMYWGFRSAITEYFICEDNIAYSMDRSGSWAVISANLFALCKCRIVILYAAVSAPPLSDVYSEQIIRNIMQFFFCCFFLET